MAASATVGALRAVLAADTAQFSKAMVGASKDVLDLSKKLKSDLAPGQREVNAAAREFLGGPEIKRAQTYALAVEKIGDISLIAAEDQKKINVAVNEALGYYKRLGTEAPANLKKLEEATKSVPDNLNNANGSMTSMLGNLKGLAGALGVGLSVGAVVSFTKAAANAAGQVVDLSKKTGLSIEAVQRLKYVAEQSGASLDQIAGSVFSVGVAIENGSTKTQDALKELGLSFEAIKNLKPEDQFDAIMRALAGIDDPQTRNRIGVELMGKAYANAAATVDDYIENLKRAPVVTEDVIKATDDAADAFDRGLAQAMNLGMQAIAGWVMMAEKAKEVLEDLARASRGINPLGPDAIGLPMNVDQGAQESTRGRGRRRAHHIANPGASGPALPQGYAEELAAARKELAALTGEQIRNLNAGVALSASTEDLAKSVGISADAVELYKDRLQDQKQAQAEASRAAEQRAEAEREVKSSIDDLTESQIAQIESMLEAGDAEANIALLRDVTAKQINQIKERLKERGDQEKQTAKEAEDAQKRITAAINKQQETERQQRMQTAKLIEDEAVKAMKLAETNRNTIAKLDEEALVMHERATLGAYDAEVLAIHRWADESIAAFKGTEEQAREFEAAVYAVRDARIAALGGEWMDALDAISRGFQQLASLVEGTMAEILSSASDAVEGIRSMDDAMSAFADGDVIGGISGMIDAVITFGKSIQSIYDTVYGNRTKENREAFAESMGFDSLDELYDDLVRLGKKGEELRERGLNVIGRNDKTGNEQWMRDVEDAYREIDRLAQNMDATLLNVLRTGQQLPPAMEPMVRQFLLAGQYSDELKNALLGVEELPWKEMEEAILSVGGSVETLGDGWKQAKLNDGAKDLMKTWTLLSKPGVDIRNSITAMSEEMSEYVQTMQRAGLEIPADMKPVLQQFVDAGELIGDNGEALENLDGLKFAAGPEEQFQKIIDKIDELIGKIIDGLYPAIEGIPNPDVRGGGGPDIPGAASGAYVPYRPGGTVFRVGEGGSDEVIVPLDGSARGQELAELAMAWNQPPYYDMSAPVANMDHAAQASLGGSMTIHNYMVVDGRVVAEAVTPHLPGAVKRHRLA